MWKLLAALLLVTVAIAFMGTAAAGDLQVYKWVDSQGVVHYSDKPPVKTQPEVTRVSLPDFPPPDPKAEAEQQAYIAFANQWYQSVLDQQAQLQYQELLAWQASQPLPTPPTPVTEQPAYVVPVCWQCDRFHFHHHRQRPPLLSPPAPQSFHTSLWSTEPNPFTQSLYKP